MTAISARVRESVRWVARPWRSPAVLISLVAAFAAPVLMVASADMFTVASGDRIAERLVLESGGRTDVVISADGLLSKAGTGDLIDVMGSRLGRVAGLGDPVATRFTESIGIGEPSVDPSIPVTVLPGSGAKFFVREGAIEALDVIDSVPDVDGIWISERYADKFDLAPGAVLGVQGSSSTVTVAGVHRDLWADGRTVYWDDAPATLVPRFSRIFGAPLFELFVASPDVIDELGLDGTTRFDVSVAVPPRTERDLVRLASDIRAVERDFTRSPELTAALDGYSGVGAAVPRLSTELFDVEDETATRTAELEQPIATTSIAGIILGLLISAAGGGFVARRRRRELRLLRSDGDAGWRFALRSIAEYALPGAVGLGAGIGLGWAVIRLAGPTRRADLADIDMAAATMWGAVGVVCASIATAIIAGSALDSTPPGRETAVSRWILPVAALAVAAWVQVGGEGGRGSVDLMVVLFPIVGLVGGVGLAVSALRIALARGRRSGGRASTALFLAWRRLTAAPVGVVGLAIVVGSAFGLVVFPTLLVASLDDAALAKARAVVGGSTSVQLLDRLDELPAESTIVRTETTRLSVAARRVSVIAVDATTYATAVEWDPHFGSSPTEVLDALEEAASELPDDAIPVLLIGSRSIPNRGAFGTTSVVDYAVVGALDAAPLASGEPTILLRADRFDEIALDRHLRLRPSEVTEEAWIEQFRSPLEQYRANLVTTMALGDVTLMLDAQEVRYRDEQSLREELGTLDNQSVRWSFSYFRILAAIAAVAAVAGLVLHLEEQRARRELADALTRRMGLSSRVRLRASLVETGGLVGVALLIGTAVAVALSTRIFDRFEPSPASIPDTELRSSWPMLVAMLGVAELIAVVVVVAVHVRGHRRSLGEILRGS